MSALAATQADGFYHPPDYDARKHGSLSKFNTNGKHRGNNQWLTHGVIRFELPFDGWCLKCNMHVSKGSRFNAKKEKAGNYMSTTIWAFGMSCSSCGNQFVIKTDPQNATYDFFEGIRKHEQDYEPDADDSIMEVASEETKAKLASDPMFRLQHDKEDKVKAQTTHERLESLIEQREVYTKQDYDANSVLRQRNRSRKHKTLEQRAQGAALGLSIPLVESSTADAAAAASVSFRTAANVFKNVERRKLVAVMAAPLVFNASSSSSSISKGSSSHHGDVNVSGGGAEAKSRKRVHDSIAKQAMVKIDTSKFRRIGTSSDSSSSSTCASAAKKKSKPAEALSLLLNMYGDDGDEE